MADFNVRSDSVNVEQIMEQIRARIREKRGVDYTEAQIRELAAVKLEKFLDPRAVRSDLLQQFQKMQQAKAAGAANVTFGPNVLFEARRPIVRKIRQLLHPVLRLFFNPDPIAQALVRMNDLDPRADMYYELFHNLVIELTRTSIEVKNLKMRIESLTGRLEFNERRARALESVVVYASPQEEPVPPARQPSAPPAAMPPRQTSPQGGGGPSPQHSGPRPMGDGAQPGEGPGQRSRRRRRRRGRRGTGSATSIMEGGGPQANGMAAQPSDSGPSTGAAPDATRSEIEHHDSEPSHDSSSSEPSDDQ